jgi:hypothetical protein
MVLAVIDFELWLQVDPFGPCACPLVPDADLNPSLVLRVDLHQHTAAEILEMSDNTDNTAHATCCVI